MLYNCPYLLSEYRDRGAGQARWGGESTASRPGASPGWGLLWAEELGLPLQCPGKVAAPQARSGNDL